MKKALLIVLVVALMISACGAPPVHSGLSDSVPEAPPAPADESSGGVVVDENLLTVDITLPASMFEEDGWLENTDIEEYKAENGFSKAVKNADGSVTVTMTKAKHRQFLSEMTASLDESFSELIESDFTPHVKSIQHSDDFKTVTVNVDRAGYENAFFEMTPFIVGFSGSIYQIFAGIEPRVEVAVCDVADGAAILNTVYPDNFAD